MSKFMASSMRLMKGGSLAVALALCAATYAYSATAPSATAPSAAVSSDDARQILKRMADYMIGQKTISMTYDSDVEVVTTEQQKISFESTGQLLISRPDKIRVHRVGGYADVDLVFNGKTLSILGKHLNSYAQMDVPGTVDHLVDQLRSGIGASVPGADLLSATVYTDLTEGITDAKHIGRGVINGVECDHLAFRTPEVDWQLWVEVGPNPIPRKYSITSKTVVGSPQYTVHIKDWRTNVAVDGNTFAFNPPSGASKVAPDKLQHIDEIPEGVARRN